MNQDQFDVGALLTGLVFALLGGLFLLDALDVQRFRWELVLPAIIIALGIAVIVGALARTNRDAA